MSAQTVLPTPEHVYIGAPPVPLNLPAGLPHRVRGWVTGVADLTSPDTVSWCDGTVAERDLLEERLRAAGTFTAGVSRLGKKPLQRPDLPTSTPGGPRVFSCCAIPEDAAPSDLWAEPAAMRRKLITLFTGCMRGRTMYVVPYLTISAAGHPGGVGIEITDSPFVVVNLGLMNRVGRSAMGRIRAREHWLSSVHSVGYPLVDAAGSRREDAPWPCNEEKWIAQFPDCEDVWSFGTGFGATALLA